MDKAISEWVGHAGSSVRMSRAATMDRSTFENRRMHSSSRFRSLLAHVKLPLGKESTLAGGTTAFVTNPAQLSVLVSVLSFLVGGDFWDPVHPLPNSAISFSEDRRIRFMMFRLIRASRNLP